MIQPRRGWRAVDFRELWTYRGLLRQLAIRDIKVRYKQTALGIAWVVLQPLMTTLIFSVLFTMLMGRSRLPTIEGVPYAISTFCGLIPWSLLSAAMIHAGSSLVDNRSLVTKIYFPRMLIPAGALVGSMLDFVIGLMCLALLMGAYRLFGAYVPHLSWRILSLPLFIMEVTGAALALALWISAFQALYRDVKYMIPFLSQVLMYATPVVYSASVVLPKFPGWAAILFELNPLTGAVEGFRWSILGGKPPSILMLIAATVGIAACLVGAIYTFRRMERKIADWI